MSPRIKSKCSLLTMVTQMLLDVRMSRKLDDKFIIDVPALSFGCSLAGVTPVGSSWNKEATLFIAQFLNQPCKMRVAGNKEGIPGILVDIKPQSGSTIKQQMITKGLAKPIQQNGAPSTPSPNNVTLPSPTASNGLRSLSRASIGSGESDVESLHARLTEKDRQLEVQQRTLNEHERQMEEQKRKMERQMEEQKREMERQREEQKEKWKNKRES
ncbi:uncharacterized protein [Amphiura filiformis]|uniref:uncharacterized protein n=1 Tax=Amphiura filiformis TaxID=82378 RepID=UPI003B20FB0F